MDAIKNYANKMKEIQCNLLGFFEEGDSGKMPFKNLQKYLNDIKIKNQKHEIRTMLHIISKISSNHHRSNDFISRIEQLLKSFSKEMKMFTKSEIFNIFKGNKLILLFLFKEKIITPDSWLCPILSSDKYNDRGYTQYFSIEFDSFKDKKPSKKDLKEFEQKRKIGENDTELCEMIRKNQKTAEPINKEKFNSAVEKSHFETNSFLLKKEPTYLEYSAFFGSSEFLDTDLISSSSSLFLYAIHSNDSKTIQILNDQKFELNEKEKYLEAMKCHHRNLCSDYIKNNYDGGNDIELINHCLKYYNFIDFELILSHGKNKLLNLFSDPEKKDLQSDLFRTFCKYDYTYFVELLLDNQNIDFNYKKILKINFFLNAIQTNFE